MSLPDGERWAFLEKIDREDPELSAEVRELLDQRSAAVNFLEAPAADLNAGASSFEEQTACSVVGKMVGPYRVERQIGEGGMGAVYLADRADDEYQHQVAVKLLRPGVTGVDLVRRFRAERQILAVLVHPNITRLLDGGTTEDSRPFLVMEYVEGAPIDQFCDERALSIDDRLELFLKVCDAVSFAHRNLVVHRDLKPSNILVTDTGEPKLLDFGIAKLLEPSAFHRIDEEATATGHRPMSPSFASPEHIRGMPITTSSDVYSLGALLYLLLTGNVPRRFSDFTIPAIENEFSREPVPPSVVASESDTSGPSRRRWRLEGDIDAVVLKALRDEPDHRYPTVAEFADDLGRYLRGLPVNARRGGIAYRTSRFLRRHRMAVGMGAVIAALVITAAGALGLQAKRIASERDRAERVAEFTASILGEASPVSGSGNDSIRSVLERSATRIDLEFSDQPGTQADLLLAVGEVYNELGMYQKARSLLIRSLDLRETYGGLLARKLSQSLAALGHALEELGEIEEGRELLERALTHGRREYGEDSNVVMLALNRLGKSHWRQSEFEEAVGRLRHARAIGERRYGAEDPRVAIGVGQLAHVLCEMGEFAEAEKLHLQSVAVLEEAGDRYRVPLADGLASLGVLYWKTGRYDLAVGEIERALEIREMLFDPNDPVIGNTMGDLANVQADRGELRIAEALLRRGLDVIVRGMGTNSPDALANRNNLASVLFDLGEIEEAYREWTFVLDGHRDLYGNQNLWTAYVLRAVALTEHYLGGDTDALRYDSESLEIIERAVGSDHPELAAGRGVSARIRLGQGDRDGAEQLLRSLLTPVEGEDPWWRWRITNHCRFAELLISERRLEEAATELAHAERIFEAKRSSLGSPRDRLRLVRYNLTLGDLRRFGGEPERAASSWQDALRILDEDTVGPVGIYHRLLRIAVLLRLGLVEEARPDAEELIALGWRRPEWLRLALNENTSLEELPAVLY